MMKRYETYKKSNLQWVKKIPQHWIEGKVKYLFEIGRGRVISQQELNPEGKYPVFSSQTKNNGCLGYIDTYDFDDNILTWTTDGANAGEVFKRNGKFNCTNVCGTLKPKKVLNLDYFLYLMKFLTPFYKRPDTNGAKIMNGEMAEIISYFPTLLEQTQIANYLDYKTGLIDAIIAQKETLIQKLKEQRQAIINEAVTKGLNPDVKLKDSGIEWLGDIPEHWEVAKLKWLSNIYSGGTPSTNIESYWTNGTIPWLNSGTVNQKRITKASEYITDVALQNSSTKWVNKGSILMALAGQGKTKGMAAMLEFDATCNQSMAAIEVDDSKAYNEFILIWLESNYLNIRSMGGGEKRDGINLQILGNIYCPLPALDEQKEIFKHVSNLTSKIEISSEELIKSIQKLKEYRQSLISEAVTGKIDVRDWQAPKS
jgi:type I restriction enzyme S subunit